MPKISVIIPVYNGEKFITTILCALDAQDYADFEVIIIDDGSSDDTGTLCQSFCNEHDRFHYYRQPCNKGISVARNRGLELAKGEYCTFIDADDWVEKDLFSTQLALMELEKADACLTGTIKEREIRPLGAQAAQHVVVAVGKQALSYDFGDLRLRSNPIFAASLIGDIRYDETVTASEDILFYTMVLSKAKKTVYDPTPRYHYLAHDESAMHQTHSYIYYESGWRAHKRIYEIAKQYDLPPSDLGKYYTEYCLSTFGMLRYAAKSGDVEVFNTVKEKYGKELRAFLKRPYLDFGRKLKYRTYLLPFKLAAMLHGYNKRNVK